MRYLRYSDLESRGRYTNRMTLSRHIELGLFPRPVLLGPNSNGWPEDEVELYDEALKAARDANVTGKEALVAFVKEYVSKNAAA